ncbi:Na(+)/citrate cotransporter-like [Dermacentor andersoni]|uniref:Na(+)/citrate cotransporter-like n=1 Tax=Dermacentor andersoni TaxID=34620 RepID=UPI002155F114|nr:sodium-dependent high-affinity dicarboxylate transporter 2-like [Dermacentor andersoni]
MTEGPSFGESTEEALWDFVMYNSEFTAKKPRQPKHTPPAQPAYPTRSSLWDPQRAQRIQKCTSFMEDGAVVLPGKDSPLPKRGYGNADESILRVPIASLFAQGIVRDVMFWETRRYVTIFQNLLICAVNASVIVSYITLYTNDANRYFVEYLHSRYGEDAVTIGTWWSLLAPMMVVSSITWWQTVSGGALYDYDAPLKMDAERTIKVALRKQLNGYRNLNNWQVASVVVFFCWVLRRSYPFVYNLQEDLIDNFDVLTVDFVMVLVALALPASSSRLLEAPKREYANLWFRLPWTALLTLGCSGYMAEAVRTADVVGWLTHWAPRSAQYKFVTQLLLTLGAAVLTELVGRKATVSVMMPVVMDIAAAVPCNPLYLCIPVTVAASTTLLLPTSSFAMAYVYDRLEIGPWDLVFCGLALKLVSIVATILTVSTLGNFIFHWNHIPDWFSLPVTSNSTGAVVGHQQGWQ